MGRAPGLSPARAARPYPVGVRTSTVLIAAAIAAASALLAWATMPSRPGISPLTTPAETFALAFDAPSVESITVTSAGETATLTRDGLGWMLTLPTTGNKTNTWPANPDAVRVLINELATQSIETGSDPDDPRSSDPLAALTIDLPEGPTTIAVTAAPIAGRLPVRITSPDGSTRRGFVPASRFRPTDVGQLAALADPKPFNTASSTGGVITRVALQPREGEGFAIQRVGGIWQLDEDFTSQPPPRLHQPTVRAMLDDLQAIRAASVIVPADITDLDRPIEDPFLTIKTTADLPRTAGEPRRQTSAMLTVDDQATVDGLTNAIATRTSEERTDALQVHLDPQSFPALPADAESLLDPAPIPWEAGDTLTFQFSNNNEGSDWLRFQKTFDGWRRESEAEKPLTQSTEGSISAIVSTLARTWPSVRRQTIPENTTFDIVLRVAPLSGGETTILGVLIDPIAVSVSDGVAVWQAPRKAAGRDPIAETIIEAIENMTTEAP